MDDSNPSKRCPRCEECKPLDLFGFDKTTKDGRNRYCKPCERKRYKAYNDAHRLERNAKAKARRDADIEEARRKERERYAANAEQYRETERRYREANPEKYEKIQRSYLETHREELRERSRRRYAEDPEAHREAVRRYRAKNPEKQKERDRKYAANRAEARREYGKLYDKQNPDKRRARERRRRALKRGALGSHTAEEVLQMYDDQQGLCAYCETPLFGTYHVDHMVPLSRGGSDAWDNLALTCQPCNQAKHALTVEEYLLRRP